MIDANQYIVDLEAALHLKDRKIDGVYFWKLVRFPLARRIEIQRGTLEPSRPGRVEKPAVKRFLRFLRSFDHCYTRPRVILFEHSRKIRHGNTFIDPYSWRVTQALESAKVDFCLLENDTHYQCDMGNPRRWFVSTTRLNRARFEALSTLPDDAARVVRDIEGRIASDLGQHIDVAGLIRSWVNTFKKHYAYFSNALRAKARNTDVLFVVCGYGKEGIVQAAKDAGIYTVELQHGTLYPLHLGYSYPRWERVPYFSDSFAIYADAWIRNVPLGGVDTRVLGCAPVGDRDPFESVLQKTGDILFISQWVNSEKVLRFAERTAELLPNRTVVCKLHPQDTLPVEAARRYPHVRIEKSGLLESYLKTAEYAVTVFSTGIFESLRYGCRPVLLDMYGVQYMRDFIDVTGAPVVSSPEALADVVADSGRVNPYRNLRYEHWYGDFDESVVLDYIGHGASPRGVR
jgi:hypothetical protein